MSNNPTSEPVDNSGATSIPRNLQPKAGTIDVVIGGIEFKDEYSDPEIDVKHTRKTSEHDVISYDRNSLYTIQARGREPATMTVRGWLTESQARIADEIVTEPIVETITPRFVGYTVPKSSSVSYSRVWHEQYGWMFESTIELLAVKGAQPE